MAKATGSRVLVQELHACIERHRKELENLLTERGCFEPDVPRENTDTAWLGDDMSEGITAPVSCVPIEQVAEEASEANTLTRPQPFGKKLSSGGASEIKAEPCDNKKSGGGASEVEAQPPPIQPLREGQTAMSEASEGDPGEECVESIALSFSQPAEAVDTGEEETAEPDDVEIQARASVRSGRERASDGRLTFKQRMSQSEKVQYEPNFAANIVKSHKFDQVCACFIVAASILVGVEVEYKNADNQSTFEWLAHITLVWFSAEILMRIFARGKRYLLGTDRAWNVFDCFCVASSYIEIIVSSIATDQGSFLLILRTLRVIRIARIVRVVRFLTHLRMMVNTMFGAVKMLGWAMLLLTMAMYMFAVSFTEATKPLLADDTFQSSKRHLLELYFSSLVRTVVTLFSSISGGVNWELPLEALAEVNVLYGFMFLFYICLVVFAMLNVITGLCCDYAIQNCVSEREDIIRAKKNERENLKKQFEQLFQLIEDGDGHQDGKITADELLFVSQDEDLCAYLAYLNISLGDIVDIYEIFDENGDGEVGMDEFVDGCMQVKGLAKQIDIVRLMKRVTEIAEQITQINACSAALQGQ